MVHVPAAVYVSYRTLSHLVIDKGDRIAGSKRKKPRAGSISKYVLWKHNTRIAYIRRGDGDVIVFFNVHVDLTFPRWRRWQQFDIDSICCTVIPTQIKIHYQFKCVIDVWRWPRYFERPGRTTTAANTGDEWVVRIHSISRGDAARGIQKMNYQLWKTFWFAAKIDIV